MCRFLLRSGPTRCECTLHLGANLILIKCNPKGRILRIQSPQTETETAPGFRVERLAKNLKPDPQTFTELHCSVGLLAGAAHIVQRIILGTRCTIVVTLVIADLPGMATQSKVQTHQLGSKNASFASTPAGLSSRFRVAGLDCAGDDFGLAGQGA